VHFYYLTKYWVKSFLNLTNSNFQGFEGSELVFDESFKNLENWNIGMPWGEYHPAIPWQWYSDVITHSQPQILTTEAITKRVGDHLLRYRIQLLYSKQSFPLEDHIFEFKAKINPAKGIWPALWLTGKDTWPPEIDLMEFYGSKGKNGRWESALHWGTPEKKGHKVYKNFMPHLMDKFHVYSIKTDKKVLSLYFDGELLFKQKLDPLFFTQPYNIILNNGVFDPSNVHVPNIFEIEYVRVWKI